MGRRAALASRRFGPSVPSRPSPEGRVRRPVEVRAARTARDLSIVRRLFREYEASLSADLCFQDFESELRSLPGPYVPPEGELLLGKVGGRIAGCAGLRRGPAHTGELKRLFVRPEFRTFGLGRALVRHVLSLARSHGYRGLVLDTLPEMEAARRLYPTLGFHETEPYGDHSVPGMHYFRLDFVDPA
jgi:putative acetyltransferase